MKFLIDLLPALAFFGAYLYADIFVATATLIASLFLLVVIYWFWEKRLHKSHFVTALVALVLGGLTLAIKDPAFIKYKPTVVYAVFSVVLLASHVIGDRVLLARLPQKAIQFPEPVWRKVNLAWALFFAFCAGLNVYIAGNYSEAAWVKFKTFGFTLLMFGFLLAHIPFVGRYLQQETH